MQFELEMIQWLQSFRNEFFDFLFQFFTYFGEELIIIGILGFLYWSYDKKIGEAVGITVFISLVLNSIIKVITARPRPFVVDSSIDNVRPHTATGYAFPSGHTQGAATTFYSFALWMKKRWITIVSIIIIVCVAISRMYLGVHYFTDVLVGGLLGILFSIGFYRFYQKNPDLQKLYRILVYILTTIFLGSYVYFLFSTSDAPTLYVKMEGIAKMMGGFFGFVLGVDYENKHTKFSNHRVIWKNLIRFVLGVVVVMGVRIGLKSIFSFIQNPEELLAGEYFKSSISILFDFLRYFAMVFIGIGLYPKLFKKFNL